MRVLHSLLPSALEKLALRIGSRDERLQVPGGFFFFDAFSNRGGCRELAAGRPLSGLVEPWWLLSWSARRVRFLVVFRIFVDSSEIELLHAEALIRNPAENRVKH